MDHNIEIKEGKKREERWRGGKRRRKQGNGRKKSRRKTRNKSITKPLKIKPGVFQRAQHRFKTFRSS